VVASARNAKIRLKANRVQEVHVTESVHIERWAHTFKILSDPTRLSLLTAIHHAGQNVLTVSELAETTGLRIPTTSAALRVMEGNGTVAAMRDGRNIYYAIADESIHRLLHWIGSTHDGTRQRERGRASERASGKEDPSTEEKHPG